MLTSLAATLSFAQAPPTFQHIIVVIQENRTPDDVFGSNPTFETGVNIHGNDSFQAPSCQGSGKISLTSVEMATCWTPYHGNPSFQDMCDYQNGACQMDGACKITVGGCNPNTQDPEYKYIDNSLTSLPFPHEVQPYFDIASAYGFANYRGC